MTFLHRAHTTDNEPGDLMGQTKANTARTQGGARDQRKPKGYWPLTWARNQRETDLKAEAGKLQLGNSALFLKGLSIQCKTYMGHTSRTLINLFYTIKKRKLNQG